MKIFKNALILLVTLLFLTNCEDEPLPPTEDEGLTTTQKINVFIEDVMEDVYLWAAETPDIDPLIETDSEAYFDKMVYSDEDKWSFITDDIEALENSFSGIETSYGWSLAFGRFSNSDNLFAIVEFVYPNTPAFAAGLTRGDIVIGMAGGDITEDNYMDLLYGESLSVTLGIITDEGIAPSSNVSMTAEELNLNPVVFTNVIEHGGRKIGYIFYAQYIAEYNASLDTAFQHLINENVTDLVLDLRYNPGGGTVAAQHLCSSIAPLDAVNNERTLVSFRWNDDYQNYWESNNITSQLKINFIDDVPHKMDLNNLYILTGEGTASASELTITGLKPYMTVKTIGATTYGKYTASITLKPEDIYDSGSYYEEFDNWGLQPIVLRYANSQGVTDFKDGFMPDIEVKDILIDDIDKGLFVMPLGNKNELLLKTAIEEITGEEVVAIATKSAAVKVPEYTLFDRGFSRFDINKRELVIDHLKKDFLKELH
ncbi:MAG: hypothetical protein GQ525_02210 [Draconibacterium sp.]|nr:hypothetical protein [Draconibacterium sp.]